MQVGTKCIRYTTEIIDYVKNNYKGKTTIDFAKELSQKFGLDITDSKLQNLKNRIKIKDKFIFEPVPNGGCYKKGQEPFNKGLKWDDYMSKESQIGSLKTTFKKGNRADNVLDIGDERMRYASHDDGYLCVKMYDGKKNRNWIPKQRVVWEKHYGKVPDRHKVIFLDGDRFNFDINNLALVSNGEELQINKLNLVSGNPELKKTAVLAVKTRFKALKKERNMKNESVS